MSETMRTIDQKIAMHKKHADKSLKLAIKHGDLNKKWIKIYDLHSEAIKKLTQYTNTEVR